LVRVTLTPGILETKALLSRYVSRETSLASVTMASMSGTALSPRLQPGQGTVSNRYCSA